MSARPTRRLAAWIPVLVVGLALVAVVALVWGGEPDDLVPDATGEGVTALDTGSGTVLVAVADGRASVEADGPEGPVRYEFDLDGDGVVTQGAGGSFEVVGAEPPGWPADFPEPLPLDVEGGSVLTTPRLLQLSTTGTTDQAPSAVLAAYEQALAGSAPLVRTDGDGGGLLGFEGPWTGYVTVEPLDGGSRVTVQVLLEPG